MNLPDWVGVLAGLDDEALSALANRGLLRRAARLAAAVELVSASSSEVMLRCEGFEIRLSPGGPSAARCGCPVAGVCVHLVAGCLWTRQAIAAAASASEPAGDSTVKTAPRVIDEVLGWEPAKVNRALGIAAVRRLAADPPTAEGLVVSEGAGQAVLSWPGSPRVVVISGGGPTGLLVSGHHSEAAGRSWRLEAVVRLFASHGREWTWPEGIAVEGVLLPEQQDTAAAVASLAELVVHGGLSQAGGELADRLSAMAQRARLDELHLLSLLTGAASASLAKLAGRDDEVTEAEVFSALAQAWSLALTLAGDPSPSAALLGGPTRVGEAAEPGRLLPLSAHWWLGRSGSRGFRLRAWDLDRQRLEEAMTGRASGTDPGFQRSWDAPLLWGASAGHLSSGLLRLQGAERRQDGTLSASTRTRVEVTHWRDLDLVGLAAAVNAASSAASRAVFGGGGEALRIVLPRRSFGMGVIELDEVSQQLVWPVTDTGGALHRLTLPAEERNVRVLNWLVERARPEALVVVGSEPESVFVREAGELRLLSLSLSPLSLREATPSWRRRLLRLDEHRRASGPLRELDPLQQLVAAVADIAESLAALGPRSPTPRQADALARRRREAADLGLGTLAEAIGPLEDPGAADLLWLRFVLDRLEILLAG